MAMKGSAEWRKFPVSLAELCLDTTLRCGQSFRWRKLNDEWTCTLHGRILSLKQDPQFVHYKATWPSNLAKLTKGATPAEDDTEALLRNYLSLNLDLGSLYQQWSDVDPNFKKKAPKFTGVRILSQDAWEALVCFICSSNNNIARISQMVHKLCIHYGQLIGHIGGEPMHDFPTPEALSGKGVESHLRELGFGYRAKYIAQTALTVVRDKGPSWLDGLKNPDHLGQQTTSSSNESATYRHAHEELLGLSGVGPKVADCVCLMGLGWTESVPVDTHVWQIAQRDYKMGKTKTKTFNKVMYDAVGDHFRGIWGQYAGWAHSVLFTADLREFAKQGVKQEEEVLESVPTLDTFPGQKRRVKTETTIAEDIKLEPNGDNGSPVELTRSTKRQRVKRR